MRPGRILHPELAKALATCGHTDIILVTDAGFPIPKDANRIDLGYYAGAVDVLDILRIHTLHKAKIWATCSEPLKH